MPLHIKGIRIHEADPSCRCDLRKVLPGSVNFEVHTFQLRHIADNAPDLDRRARDLSRKINRELFPREQIAYQACLPGKGHLLLVEFPLKVDRQYFFGIVLRSI